MEYAYRHRNEYQAVLWVLADTRESLVSGYIALATLLNLPQKNEQDQDMIIKEVKNWLQTHGTFLLILDNADELALVREFLPPTFGGHLLLTTRAQAVGRLAHRVEVETMQQNVGALFLLRRACLIGPEAILTDADPADIAQAREITNELGGLPLALDQAGAYIERSQCSLLDYRQRYQMRRSLLLQQRGDLVEDHPEPVATTWSLSFERAEEQCPASGDLLRVCAFLAADAIPEEIITQGAVHLGERLQPMEADPFLLDEAISALAAYSLLRRERTTKMLSVHRLVQAVLRDTMDEQTQQQWAERDVLAVNVVFPEVEFETWSQCERYLPHAQTLTDLVEQRKLMLLEAASLLDRVGMYLYDRGRYGEAEPVFMRVLEIREQRLGKEHLETGNILHHLAILYQEQGKYAEAEELYQRALAICEQELGERHPETAISLVAIAQFYMRQRRYAETMSLLRRALTVFEQELGLSHPHTATCLHDLAHLYQAHWNYARAEELYRRALVICEQELGERHPETATILNNLATLYQEQGKYAEAEELYRRALAICEQELGERHPETAAMLSSLAILYQEQGKYAEAEELYRRALVICEQELGERHPETAAMLQELASLYQSQGKHEKAEPLYRRAFSVLRRTLGLEHPHTQECWKQYVSLLQAMGRDKEAQVLWEEGRLPEEPTGYRLEDYRQVYQSHRLSLLNLRGNGLDHPDPVAATWSLSFDRVRQKSPVAVEVLYLCVYLEADAIPLAIMIEGIEPITADLFALEQAIEVLRAYSLVKHDPATRTLSVHRPVQAVIREGMSAYEQREWMQRAIRRVHATFPDPRQISQWNACERWLSHVLICALWIEQAGLLLPEAADLLCQAGCYLSERARYAEAEPLYRRALMIWEKHSGPDHAQVAHSLKGLANLYFEQGKYAEAESLYRRALSIWEKQSGPDHPDVAYPLNNLANLYCVQGKYARIEPLYRRALSIWEKQLGPDHAQVAYPLNGLANLYSKQGKYAEAKSLYRRALSIWEKQLGPDHPQVACPLCNLANLYRKQGKYAEAEPLYRQALKIREEQLGPNHPEVAYPLNGLAGLYRKQGKDAEAEPLYRRALEIREEQLGPDHSLSKAVRENLVSLLRKREKKRPWYWLSRLWSDEE